VQINGVSGDADDQVFVDTIRLVTVELLRQWCNVLSTDQELYSELACTIRGKESCHLDMFPYKAWVEFFKAGFDVKKDQTESLLDNSLSSSRHARQIAEKLGGLFDAVERSPAKKGFRKEAIPLLVTAATATKKFLTDAAAACDGENVATPKKHCKFFAHCFGMFSDDLSSSSSSLYSNIDKITASFPA
jgi:hypothetical protein